MAWWHEAAKLIQAEMDLSMYLRAWLLFRLFQWPKHDSQVSDLPGLKPHRVPSELRRRWQITHILWASVSLSANEGKALVFRTQGKAGTWRGVSPVGRTHYLVAPVPACCNRPWMLNHPAFSVKFLGGQPPQRNGTWEVALTLEMAFCGFPPGKRGAGTAMERKEAGRESLPQRTGHPPSCLTLLQPSAGILNWDGNITRQVWGVNGADGGQHPFAGKWGGGRRKRSASQRDSG